MAKNKTETEKYNAKKTRKIEKLISASLILTLTVFMINSIPATTHVFAVSQTSTTLPTCTDPTGQNLPCMMLISTLTPPANAVQCQESSGQILPCSYATQNLSNGQQVVVITVYTPTNYVFGGYGPWTVAKLIVHETKTRVVHVPECPKGQRLDSKTHKCVDIQYCPPPIGHHIDSITHKCIKDPPCLSGQVYNPVTGKCEYSQKCERADSNAVTDPDKNLKTKDCDLGDANEHVTTSPIQSCNSPIYNGTCLPTNNIAASGGKGTGPACINNCTTGTLSPPTVDCNANPSDPSCPQTAHTPPTTQTCPGGSTIPTTEKCPTTSTPSNPSNPSSGPSILNNINSLTIIPQQIFGYL